MPAGSAGSVPAPAESTAGPVAGPAAGPACAAAGRRWADLRTRTLSALVLGAAALAGMWWGGAAWAAVVALGACALAAEWAALTRHPWRGAPLSGPSRACLGLLYLLPGCASLAWLRLGPASGLRDTAFLLLVVWASDVGAYVAGRALGGPKLAPWISPGKTWSGGAGGLCAAVAVGAGFGSAAAVAAAALLGIVSQAGDLGESAIKRGFGVKDSGRIIPGHGGLLDRVDGLIVAAPVAAGLAALMGPGMPPW